MLQRNDSGATVHVPALEALVGPGGEVDHDELIPGFTRVAESDAVDDDQAAARAAKKAAAAAARKAKAEEKKAAAAAQTASAPEAADEATTTDSGAPAENTKE